MSRNGCKQRALGGTKIYSSLKKQVRGRLATITTQPGIVAVYFRQDWDGFGTIPAGLVQYVTEKTGGKL